MVEAIYPIYEDDKIIAWELVVERSSECIDDGDVMNFDMLGLPIVLAGYEKTMSIIFPA